MIQSYLVSYSYVDLKSNKTFSNQIEIYGEYYPNEEKAKLAILNKWNEKGYYKGDHNSIEIISSEPIHS